MDRTVEGPTPPANHESANRERALAEPRSSLPERTRVFTHVEDGDLYVRTDETLQCEVKLDGGSWQVAVHYRPVQFWPNGQLAFSNRKQYTTSEARWAERFREVPRG